MLFNREAEVLLQRCLFNSGYAMTWLVEHLSDTKGTKKKERAKKNIIFLSCRICVFLRCVVSCMKPYT